MINGKKIIWKVTPKEAIELQHKLREEISLVPLTKKIKTVAGIDVSLNRFGVDLYSGIIVLSYPDLIPVDQATHKSKVTFPYVPGLLSFREIPGLLECFNKLNIKPDLIFVDGQGIAHPRRLGIATHFGLVIGVPTIGVGKSVLTGVYKDPKDVGEVSDLVDKKTGEVIGRVLKSKVNSKPLIISPGNFITLDESIRYVKSCLKGYRLPEPTRLAHILVNAFRVADLENRTNKLF